MNFEYCDDTYSQLYRACEVTRGECGYSDSELAYHLARFKVGKMFHPRTDDFDDALALMLRDKMSELVSEVQVTKFFYTCNYKGEEEGDGIVTEHEAALMPEYCE